MRSLSPDQQEQVIMQQCLKLASIEDLKREIERRDQQERFLANMGHFATLILQRVNDYPLASHEGVAPIVRALKALAFEGPGDSE